MSRPRSKPAATIARPPNRSGRAQGGVGAMPCSCRSGLSGASGISCWHYLARPRNTVNARFNRTTSSSLSLPSLLPIRAFGTVVTLSIINRDALFRPLRSVGSTSIRSKGASVGSVVNAQSVIELVASNRSSCTMTAGRGLPAYGAPPDTVQISPRFTRPDSPWRSR